MIFLATLLGMKIPANGMEMGGFDISVGEGEIEDFPSEWQEDSGWEPELQGGLSGDSPGEESTQSQWEQENVFEEEMWNTPENFDDISRETQEQQSPPSDGQQEIIQENSQGNTMESLQNESMEEDVYDKGMEESTAESNRQNDLTGNTGPNLENSPKDNRKTDAALREEIKELTNIPTEIPTQTPTHTPTPVPTKTPVSKPSQTLTESAAIVSNVLEGLPTPVPVLDFFQRKSDVLPEKEELCIFYLEESVSPCDVPQFRITSNCPVQILSVRINKRECLWHCREDLLVLECPAQNKENSIELIAFYEAGGDMSAVFQNS